MQLICLVNIVYFSTLGFTLSLASIQVIKDISERQQNGTDLKRLLKNRNRAEKLACRGVDCSPGRQCALDDAGQVTCICIKKCSKNDRPICASNGETFRNKCEMHRYACMAGIHLSKNHSKPCLASESHQPITKKIRPIVCYEKDRDTIHEKILEWIDSMMAETAKNKFQIIQDKFLMFDSDFDGTLSSAEFQTFIESNEAVSVIANITDPYEQDASLIRGICVDALIESADVDQDWKLNLGELLSCLQTDFSPLKRKCSLDDKEYDDGNAVKKKCNVCVCACGNWVCTAHICDDSKPTGDNHKVEDGGIDEDDLVMTRAEWEAKLKALGEGALQISDHYIAPVIGQIGSPENTSEQPPSGQVAGEDDAENEDETDVFGRLGGGPLISGALDLVKETSENVNTNLGGFVKQLG